MRFVNDDEGRANAWQCTPTGALVRPDVQRHLGARRRTFPLCPQDRRNDGDNMTALMRGDRERDPRLARADRLQQECAVPDCEGGHGPPPGVVLMGMKELRRREGTPVRCPSRVDCVEDVCERRARRSATGDLCATVDPTQRFSDDSWPRQGAFHGRWWKGRATRTRSRRASTGCRGRRPRASATQARGDRGQRAAAAVR